MKFTKETARRALRTFLQVFLPALAVGIRTITFADDGSLTRGAIITLVIPAVAAGLSAVMNLERTDTVTEEGSGDDEISGVG